MALPVLKGNEIPSAVAVAIRSKIPKQDLTNIYKDKPRQDFEYCSLYIDVVNSEQEREMRRRGQRTVFLDLRLHPKRDQSTAQSWCREMAERIIDATDTIEVFGLPLRCRDMNFYYVEKEQVMHIFLVYAFKTLRTIPGWTPGPYMEELDRNERLKYGKDD